MRLCLLILILCVPLRADTEPKILALRLFNRLAGYISESDPRLNQMSQLIARGSFTEAAQIATQDPQYGNLILRRYFQSMSTRELNHNVPLNVFTATGMGIVWENRSYKEIVTANAYYTLRNPTNVTLPAYSSTNSAHYEAADTGAISIAPLLQRVEPQRANYTDAAGLLTTDAFLRQHAIAGTNRRIIQFAYANFLGLSLDQLKDTSVPVDRVRRDVDRKPGNDPMIFQTTCRACHGHLDAAASAFNRYDATEREQGKTITVTPSYATQAPLVVPKVNLLITFPQGYIEGSNDRTDEFEIRATQNQNAAIGWQTTSGKGAKDFGKALSETHAFAFNAVERVWAIACNRSPSTEELPLVNDLARSFKITLDYRLRRLFEAVAVLPECLGR